MNTLQGETGERGGVSPLVPRRIECKVKNVEQAAFALSELCRLQFVVCTRHFALNCGFAALSFLSRRTRRTSWLTLPRSPGYFQSRVAVFFAIAVFTQFAVAADPALIDEPTEAERNFWSFRRLSRPEEPTVAGADRTISPIDRFVLARLEERGLVFAAEADRRMLIRRLSLDLIGLPPSPAEVEEFLADRAPDAYEKLVDRWLASSHYGERWGRQWLDVVGYSDSNGYIRHDTPRPLAWRYRDYVIHSLNNDKPYDQWWREQLAGDELVSDPAGQPRSTEDLDKLIATHFLRNAPDGTDTTEGNEITRVMERYAVLESQLQITMSAMFGMTIECARCHNHKFDPIPQRDYYSLQAIFYPAFNVKSWTPPKDRYFHLAGATEVATWRAAHEQVERDIAALRAEFETWVAKHRPPVGGDSVPTSPQKESEVESQKESGRSPNLQAAFDEKLTERKRQLTEAIAAVEKRRMAEPERVAWTTDLSDQPPVVPLLKRGDYFQHGPAIDPGPLSVLVDADNAMPIEPPPSGAKTTGRRLAFARWATRPGSRAAALLARVEVDRLWRGHFGQGLVPSPENFGASGVRPTHPELLEWLAAKLVDGGWRLKSIHREIVLSRTYRQTSVAEGLAIERDPDNLWYGRFPAHRLDAESIRDCLLAAAGTINFKAGGPAIEFVDRGTRQIVLPAPTGNGPHEVDRRSIYIRHRRSQPLTFLQVFDQAAPEPNCVARSTATVVAQSLAMLNGDFAVRMGRDFAARVEREAGPERDARIRQAFRVALAREPDATELARCAEFLRRQSTLRAQADPQTADRAALADFCRMLLATNEFIQVQ